MRFARKSQAAGKIASKGGMTVLYCMGAVHRGLQGTQAFLAKGGIQR